jgi:23S rRNA (adenine2503-C2)-methyltransferase
MTVVTSISSLNDIVVVPRAPTQTSDKQDLLGLDRSELRDALVVAGISQAQVKMRSAQLWHWIYHRGLTDFAKYWPHILSLDGQVL